MTRPAPHPTAISKPFYDAAHEGRLVIQHCTACGHLQHYPRTWCTQCLSEALDWSTMSGRGFVYAHTIVRRAMNPAFADKVPYVYGLVELDEGPRLTTNIVGVDVDAVTVGMRVRVVFDDVGDGISVPLFTAE